jgi:predicted RNA binding protein YcfA (HicA-like mRNA interferase family)
MSIDYARLHSLTAREIISALHRDGFHPRPGRKGTGSHQRFQHPDGRRATVTFHKSSDTFPPKTLKNMFEQAHWTEDDLRRLKLIR